MTRQSGEYSLTHDDRQLPDHYGWKVASRLEAIEAKYQSLAKSGNTTRKEPTVAELRRQAQEIVKLLDAEGRWISTFAGEPLYGQPKFKPGDKFINSAVFSRNLETLSAFLTAAR